MGTWQKRMVRRLVPGKIRSLINSRYFFRRVGFFVRRRFGVWPWPIYPDDVFLVSFPRSGNTWVSQMIALIKHPGLDLRKKRVQDYIPDPYFDPIALERVVRPRVIKSHEPYIPNYPKVIYLYRDGRDCIVSWYDVQKKLYGYKGTIDEFALSCLSDFQPFGSWQEHVRSWLLVPHNTPILKIQYEALCETPFQHLKKIADFLGLDPGDSVIDAAIQGSTRQIYQAFIQNKRPDYWAKGFSGGVKGGPGKWREVFSDDLLELYWKYAGEVMESLGYQKR